MNIKPVYDFVSLFGTSITFDEDLITKKGNRYFLLNSNLKRSISRDFFYAGTYIGKVKNEKFFPGFELLGMIAEKKTNKVVVDKKTEWLFICGRDIFKRGIIRLMGLGREGDYVLVLNSHGECLGFGRAVYDLNKEKEGVVVRNISDIGDFLRREKQDF